MIIIFRKVSATQKSDFRKLFWLPLQIRMWRQVRRLTRTRNCENDSWYRYVAELKLSERSHGLSCAPAIPQTCTDQENTSSARDGSHRCIRIFGQRFSWRGSDSPPSPALRHPRFLWGRRQWRKHDTPFLEWPRIIQRAFSQGCVDLTVRKYMNGFMSWWKEGMRIFFGRA